MLSVLQFCEFRCSYCRFELVIFLLSVGFLYSVCLHFPHVLSFTCLKKILKNEVFLLHSDRNVNFTVFTRLWVWYEDMKILPVQLGICSDKTNCYEQNIFSTGNANYWQRYFKSSAVRSAGQNKFLYIPLLVLTGHGMGGVKCMYLVAAFLLPQDSRQIPGAVIEFLSICVSIENLSLSSETWKK